MQLSHHGLLASYNSLQDKHLTEFYSSDHPQRLRHLIRAGLITKEGYIVNDTTLRLKNALKQQKRPALANGSIDLPGSKAVKAKILANQSHTTAQLTQTKTIIGRIPHSPYLSRSFSTCKPLPLQPKSSHKRSQTLPSVQTMYTTHCYPMRSGVHVTLRYLGQSVHLEGSVKHDTVDVVIMQQPCFGDTVCVFDGKVKLKGQFTFTSRRHLDCPFGVSIFLDHMFDCRLSTCCEYKHQPRKILGSKTSHFYLVKVEGGKACCKCQGTADPPSMNKKTTNEVSPIPVKDSKESNMQINVDDNRCKSKNQANSPDTFEFGADKSPPTNDNNVVSPSHSRDVPSSQENSVEQPPIVKRSVVFSPDTKDDQETITLNNAKERKNVQDNKEADQGLDPKRDQHLFTLSGTSSDDYDDNDDDDYDDNDDDDYDCDDDDDDGDGYDICDYDDDDKYDYDDDYSDRTFLEGDLPVLLDQDGECDMIITMMKQKNIEMYDNVPKYLKHFVAYGEALFFCNDCGISSRWSSHNATIKVNLISKCVQRKYKQRCKKCRYWATPQFTKDRFESVITRVLKCCKKRKAIRRYCKVITSGHTGRHPRRLCERCKALKRPCNYYKQ